MCFRKKITIMGSRMKRCKNPIYFTMRRRSRKGRPRNWWSCRQNRWILVSRLSWISQKQKNRRKRNNNKLSLIEQAETLSLMLKCKANLQKTKRTYKI